MRVVSGMFQRKKSGEKEGEGTYGGGHALGGGFDAVVSLTDGHGEFRNSCQVVDQLVGW